MHPAAQCLERELCRDLVPPLEAWPPTEPADGDAARDRLALDFPLTRFRPAGIAVCLSQNPSWSLISASLPLQALQLFLVWIHS